MPTKAAHGVGAWSSTFAVDSYDARDERRRASVCLPRGQSRSKEPVIGSVAAPCWASDNEGVKRHSVGPAWYWLFVAMLALGIVTLVAVVL